jgi:16S rRNA (guanine527-N7)-methyltransferase
LPAVNSREFQDRLASRARAAGVTVPPELGGKLETYYRLLVSWSRKINLTGVDLAEPTPGALDRLLIEPMVAARHVPADVVRMIDIGSGGGSPAIPLALTVPGLRLVMVESKIRKSVFLKEVSRALEMQADVQTSRFQALLATPDLHEAHDLLTIRAVRVDSPLLMSLHAFVRPGGHMFLFRSTSSDVPTGLPPSLTRVGSFPLVEPLRSRLLIIAKGVPRGT